MSGHALPVRAKFWTPGVLVLAVFMARRRRGRAGAVHRRHRLRVQPEHRPALGDLDRCRCRLGSGAGRRRLHHRLSGAHPRPALLRARHPPGPADRHAGLHLRRPGPDRGHRPLLGHLETDGLLELPFGFVRSGHVRDVLCERALHRIHPHRGGALQGAGEPAGPALRPQRIWRKPCSVWPTRSSPSSCGSSSSPGSCSPACISRAWAR